MTEQVIKFITVRVDTEQKRLAKVKAMRDSKVRGKGTRAVEAAAEAARQPRWNLREQNRRLRCRQRQRTAGPYVAPPPRQRELSGAPITLRSG